MGLGFLVDQIYLVNSGNCDPHAKNLRFFCFFFFLFTELYWTALINHRSLSYLLKNTVNSGKKRNEENQYWIY